MMRSTLPSAPYVVLAPLLLGSTLVYALPQANQFTDLEVASGVASPPSPDPSPASSPNVNSGDTSPTSNAQANPSSTAPGLQIADTDTAHDSVTNSASIHSTFGSTRNTQDSLVTALDDPSPPAATASASSASEHGTLAPIPTSAQSASGHGVLIGVVSGGIVVGILLLVVGLWLCYRRRGPNSGASTPRYTTPVVGDEKQRSMFAFLKGSTPWKKSHHSRIRSSLSFASPILENEPKMMESASSSRTPLAPHLSGSTVTRNDWKDTNTRWSTFSSSDSSVYPQTPVARHLSGVIMETVVESDAPSNPQTPTMASARPDDFLILQRSARESKIPLPPLSTTFDPRFSPPASQHYTDDASTPTTMSSGGRTFGSAGHGAHYLRTSSATSQPPALPTQFQNGSGGSFRSGSSSNGSNGTALLNARPKFSVTYPNGSGTVSIGQTSGETVRITNPFLDDEDELSSYGHGMLEEEMDGDRRSLRSMDSAAHGAYPSSTGCLDPKIAPTPEPDHLTARPRSSLISDSSSDYPYPLGYAVDADGNVANPFLRISELLEEVDGRMRWPSPPLLPRTESRNY